MGCVNLSSSGCFNVYDGNFSNGSLVTEIWIFILNNGIDSCETIFKCLMLIDRIASILYNL